MRRCWAPFAAALLAPAALGLTGCGGDDEPDPGPALLAPADAPVYFDAVVDPDGEQREALQSSLGGLLGEPAIDALIAEQLEDALEGEDISWSEDVEPWAGSRVGLFVAGLDDDADGALIVEIEDEDAYEEAEARMAARIGPATDATDDGVGYSVWADESASVALDGHLVAGDEGAVRAAIEASDGEPLGESDEFEQAVGDLSADRLATVYVEPAAILDALEAEGEIDATDRDRVTEGFGATAETPIALALGATSASLVAEITAATEDGSAGTASELIERAPDDAWLAFGIGGGSGLDALVVAGDADPVDSGVSGDVTEMLTALTDVGGFVAGTSLFGLSAALVGSEREPGSLIEPLADLEQRLGDDSGFQVRELDADDAEGFALIPADVPIQLPVALRDELLVAALGTDALSQALDPQTTIADSEAFDAAVAEDLDDDLDPFAYLDFDRMLELLGSFGFAGDPDVEAAQPYLERLDRFVAGTREDSGRSLSRLVLTVREGDGSE